MLYEDDQVLTVNKPAGLPVIGDGHEMDMLMMAREAGEHLRPAHRIDKETSGATVFAKTPQAHATLARQFTSKTIDKSYLALVAGGSLPQQGVIRLPLSVGRKNRVRVAAQRTQIAFDEAKNCWFVDQSARLSGAGVYPSVTLFRSVYADSDHAFLVVRPMNGRRHQIRVHFAWIGYPILGDPLFVKGAVSAARTMLHSWRIGFKADWLADQRIEVEAEPDLDFWQVMQSKLPFDDVSARLQEARAASAELDSVVPLLASDGVQELA